MTFLEEAVTMRPSIGSLLCVFVLASLSTAVAPAARAGSGYTVLEIARFDVNPEDFSTKEKERAVGIPEETFGQIHRSLLGEMTRAQVVPRVRRPEATTDAGERVIVLSGRVVDWKAGSRAARLLVGFGAGAQKIAVECVLKDKATGKELARRVISDTKWAGITGGDEQKGISDFAEKVMAFVRTQL